MKNKSSKLPSKEALHKARVIRRAGSEYFPKNQYGLCLTKATDINQVGVMCGGLIQRNKLLNGARNI